MRVIFLDFDGVLNCQTRWKDGCVQVDEQSSSMLDPDAVGRVATLVREMDAHIVISSTWRRFYELDVLRGYLAQFGVPPERVIDVTPYLIPERKSRWTSVPRGHEIRAWLNEHPEVTSFVVLDDDSDMNGVERHFVKTTWLNGLRDEHIQKAIKILSKTIENRA